MSAFKSKISAGKKLKKEASEEAPSGRTKIIIIIMKDVIRIIIHICIIVHSHDDDNDDDDDDNDQERGAKTKTK